VARRCGDFDAAEDAVQVALNHAIAAAHFRAAADGTANEAERNYLVLKAASLQSARR